MGLAENIKHLREQHGLTQKEFGESLDVSAATVSTWEIGTRQPRMGVIEKMSRLYGVKKSDIIDEKETPTPKGERVSQETQDALLQAARTSILIEEFEKLSLEDQNDVICQVLLKARNPANPGGQK